MEDEDLPVIRALQAGDDAALDVLMARHRDWLFAYLCRLLGNEADAADVLQETFVRVYFQRDRFQPRAAAFRSWLFRIAANLAHDLLRKRRRRPALLGDQTGAAVEGPDGDGGHPAPAAETASSELTPAEQSVHAERLAAVRAAVGELPAALRDALVLFELEGHSQRECAALLATTPKAVETRVARARRLLAGHLRRMLA